MPTPNDAIAAIAAKDPALLQAFLVKRIIYLLDDSEDPTDFTALVAGSIPLAIGWHDTIFWLDPDDATTPGDGVTSFRTDDDYCYKANAADLLWASVLDRDLTVPPVSPSEGDTYLVKTAATGDWSGHDDELARWDGVQWIFCEPHIGYWLLVEDEDLFIRWTSGGAWASGTGSLSVDDASISITALIGANLLTVKVENQTTTAEPGSPTKGTNYIIGAGATGTNWAGNDGKVAMCVATGVWKIITPVTGDRVYDKAQNIYYRYNGTSWASDSGAIVGAGRTALTTSGSETTGGSGGYTFSTTPPTTALLYREDSVTLTYQAKKAGAVLEFEYRGNFGASIPTTVALFMDAVSNAVDWCGPPVASSENVLRFTITTADALSHTYKIRQLGSASAILRRQLCVREYA